MSAEWRTISYQSSCSDPMPPPAMAFEPVVLPDTCVEKYDAEGRRWYVQGDHVMGSITTILKATDREGELALDQWRNRVGHDIAGYITETAANDGTRWHNFCEHYVQGSDVTPYITRPGDWEKASAVAHMLNHQIKRVVASENRIANPEARAAGRMDMAVELHNGKYAILDFKNGKRAKSGNRLRNYGLQTTFYADTLGPMIGKPIDTVIIAQLNEDSFLWQVSKPKVFREALTQRIDDFYRRMETPA